MQHIQATLDLGTMQGSVGVIPDYGPTNISTASVPSWVLAAPGNIRTDMPAPDLAARWAHLRAHVIPKWRFYAMPHSVLLSLGNSRPTRPYWPNPGDNKSVIQNVLRILQEGRNGTLARLYAVNVEDGYDYHVRRKRATKPPKGPGTTKRGKGKDRVEEPQATKQEHVETRNQKGSKGKKKGKARSPVPSQTGTDEGQVLRTRRARDSTDWFIS